MLREHAQPPPSTAAPNRRANEQVTTESELADALQAARGPEKDALCFIECVLHKDDCSAELLEWGARVAAANARPPASG